ncbi:MAG: J domain-containing protein [Leifsonia sp.]
MPESPAASTPYEVLGVAATATDRELRQAYRRRLRVTHPDVGGSAVEFQAVQTAWERIGTPQGRAAYDGHRFAEAAAHPTRTAGAAGTYGAGGSGTGAASGRATQSGPKARMHGHPGGVARQRYLTLIREWSGRGTTLADPYAPHLIRSAPREIRHTLAQALAQESTAQLISSLGIGYTAWHDVEAGHKGDKLDHVALGPAGLFAIMSEDWGSTVELKRGELVGESLDAQKPIQALEDAARAFSRALRVKFTALVLVLPDGALGDVFELPARGRRPILLVVPRSRLVGLLREGMPGMSRGSFEKVFELRSTLHNGVTLLTD